MLSLHHLGKYLIFCKSLFYCFFIEHSPKNAFLIKTLLFLVGFEFDLFCFVVLLFFFKSFPLFFIFPYFQILTVAPSCFPALISTLINFESGWENMFYSSIPILLQILTWTISGIGASLQTMCSVSWPSLVWPVTSLTSGLTHLSLWKRWASLQCSLKLC